ncbi:pseudouridine synthase [Sphingomonas sp. SUN039]|uniref:pseudouridine synthase n=1 Tax=Sphingomonas sp. SUN039 TaxID=2937787 RepID=UPI0038D3BEEF
MSERPKDSQRIAKLLARAGIASRREIERMIEDRRIAIDGVPLETPATIVTSLKGITVDGNPVAAPEPTRLFRYHKPTGLLTAERDMKGRATIYDKLPPDMPRTVPVGRLDLNTEGLLLMTTDGTLKRRLELPTTGLPRSYRARVYGRITQDSLEELIHGITIDGVRYGAIDANLERRTGTNTWVEMTIREGKNREVRRILEHLGVEVNRLIRTQYGPFSLGDLPPGAVEEVKQHELVEFLKSLGEMPAAPVHREPGDGALRKQWRITPKRTPSPSPFTGEGDTRAARRGEGRGASAPQGTPVPQYRPDPPKTPKPPRPAAAPPRDATPDARASRPKPKASWAKAKPKPNSRPRKK